MITAGLRVFFTGMAFGYVAAIAIGTVGVVLGTPVRL
jgi:hypothetical protein